MSTMLGCKIMSMLCVPVASRATGQVVALACAFNKQGGQRYKCSVLTLQLWSTTPPLFIMFAQNTFSSILIV